MVIRSPRKLQIYPSEFSPSLLEGNEVFPSWNFTPADKIGYRTVRAIFNICARNEKFERWETDLSISAN